MAQSSQLQKDYPWTRLPLVSCGPMRLIALAPLATEISAAGGLGFIGAGSDASTLDATLKEVKDLQSKKDSLQNVQDVLPVGVGFLIWAGEKLLHDAIPVIEKYRPAAIWLFAPNVNDELVKWTNEVRKATASRSKIWIQVGTVKNALEVTRTCKPDVLVVQGTDAGGHGLQQCAGLFALFPEVDDAVTKLCKDDPSIPKPILTAAGGIMDGRGMAAAVALGAEGITMGTRYLAAHEANIAQGYREAVIQASDGGVNTARGKLYDSLRGTTDWPEHYGGRGVLNHSWYDAAQGMTFEENKRLHDLALKKGDEGWGEQARLTTYAGTGVGLATEVKGAAAITEEVREGAKKILSERGRQMSSFS